MRAVRQFLDKQGKQFRELTKLFFNRFSENDLICLDGDTSATMINILGLVAAPGLMFPVLEHFIYGFLMGFRPLWWRDLFAIEEKGLYIGFSMTVLGIITVLEWDTLLPDRRDYLVLRPFPVSLKVILGSKIAALFAFWTVFTLAINAVSTVMFPLVVVQRGPLDQIVWFIRCHALTMVAANAFVFLAILSVQGVLMSLLGWRWFRRVSPYAQLLLMGVLVALFFFGRQVAETIGAAKPVTEAMRITPVAWFIGFYQAELGWTDPGFLELAARARFALGITGLTAVAALAISYTRHVRTSLEVLETQSAAPGRLVRNLTDFANRACLRTAPERAAFHFVWQTLLRSRKHRSLLAAWAGGGFALLFQGLASVIATGAGDWWKNPQGVLLPAPLVLSFFILCGIRYVFTVPSELRSNWLFQFSGSTDVNDYMPGMRKAAILIGIVPLHAVLLPIHIALWGWIPACVHILYSCIISWLLMEVLLVNFAKVPFTCSYVAGKANMKAMWWVYVSVFVGYVSAFSAIEYLILKEPAYIVFVVLFAALVRTGIVLYRKQLESYELDIIFNDRPEPAVRTLNLSQP